jgi:CubicO group peptidase (beta-lactamase class C family)
MRRIWRTAVAALVIAGACIVGRPSAQQQQPSIFTPAGTLPVLDTYLESLRQQAGIPGMSALVLREGAVVWEKGFGYSNLAARIRATPDTPYLVGDLSQTVAAVLLLQCVEQRRLELDTPLDQYGLQLADSSATLRQLLSHSAPSGSDLPFVYSPQRYAQLTALMEWCAPQPYRKSVAHRILDHLAMRDSVPGTDLQDPNLSLPDGLFDPDDLDRYRQVLSRIAVPYKVDGRGRAERSDLPLSSVDAAGGLVSTVRDLAELDKDLDKEVDDGGLLTADTRELAWTPVVTQQGAVLPTGLGWFVQSYKGERVVWHFGYIPNGYSALLLKLPARKLTFILLANSDGLSSKFQLSSGDVTRSVFATLFLKLAT